jgi:hypothetical protein
MSRLDAILQALNGRKSKLLDMAQAALPAQQFAAFRKLVLNELGRQGFEQDLERIIAKGNEQEWNGQGRPIYARKEVPHE